MRAMSVAVEENVTKGKWPKSTKLRKRKQVVKQPQASLSELFQFASAVDWVLIWIAVVGSLASGMCTPLLLFYFSASIETIGETSSTGTFDMSEAAFQATAMVLVGVAFWAMTALYMAAMDTAKVRQVAKLKKAYLRAIVGQDVAWFDLNSPQMLASKIGESMIVIEEGISNKFIQLFENLGSGLGFLVLAMLYAPDVTLVMVATTPIVAISGFVLNHVQQHSQAIIGEAYATAGGIASEALNSIRTVAAFGLERRVHSIYRASLAQAERAAIRESWLAGLAFSTFSASPFFMAAVGLYYGGTMLYIVRKETEWEYTANVGLGESAYDALLIAANVTNATLRYCVSNCTSDQYDSKYLLPMPLAKGTCSEHGLDPFRFTCLTAAQGAHKETANLDFLTFFAQTSYESFATIADSNGSRLGCERKAWKMMLAWIAVLMGAMQLGITRQNMTTLNKARQAAVDVLATISREPPVDAFSENGERLTAVRGEVELVGVTFAYPVAPTANVCDGYSLRVEPGQVMALCGPSGSGKSTVIALLERFYDPQQGLVLLDGVDIRTLNVRWLRQQMGLVAQEPVLFMGTVAENIEYGKEGATHDEIEAAAALANAHNFVERLPEGYNTQVGQGGSKLSGGQKQRLAIARAIIKAPAVLLLDEATSALDTHSERVVQAALDKIMAQMKRTTITIAHRLSTIRHADTIAVVNQGKVVEQGSFDELMALEGHFYTLSQTMSEGYRNSRASRLTRMESSLEEGDSSLDIEDGTLSHNVSLHAGGTSAAEATGATAEQVLSMPPLPSIAKVLLRRSGSKEVSSAAGSEGAAARGWLKNGLFSKLMAHQDKGDGYLFGIGSFFAILSGGAMPALGLILSKVLTTLYYPNPGRLLEAAVVWATVYILASVTIVVAGTCEAGFFGTTGQHLTRRLRDVSMAKLLRMEVGYFDEEENSSGSLSAFLSEKITLVQAMNGEKLGALVRNFCTMVVGFSIAFIYGYWQLALVMTATIIPISLAMKISMIIMMGAGRLDDGSGSKAGSLMGEVVVGIRTVTSFGAERRFHEAYCTQVDATVGSCCRGSIYSAWAAGIAAGFGKGFPLMAQGGVFYYGFHLINQEIGRLSPPDSASIGRCPSMMDEYLLKFMVPIMVFMFLASSIGMTASMATDTKMAKRAALEFFGRMERRSCIDPLSNQGTTMPSVRGGVELRDVQFAYPTRPQVKVCDGYSLRVEPGQVVALCGPSGSGKSTVIALLERFYDPQQGQVLLDGVDIRTLNVRWLREQLGLVAQEPVLFTGTVAENIEYGKEGATRDEVIAAARMADAHDFITQKLVHGYNTDVGSRGAQLSGGQKQRIAIARALVRQPAVLLLDEATSALDYESEGFVQAAIDQLTQEHDFTTIMIAHRLNTICHADQIAVVNQGAVVEQGTHAELLERGEHGVYAQLWAAQM